MVKDPDQIVVPGTGSIYLGTVGTSTIPTNVSAAIDIAGTDGWVEAGYTTEDGVSFKVGRTTKEIKGWQSLNTLRRIVTGTPTSVGFTFLQMNHATWRAAMGGGSWTGSSPNFKYTPPPANFVDERALIIEGIDGNFTYRAIFRRVMLSDDVEFKFVREDPISLPTMWDVLATDTAEHPWEFQTNDPEMGDFVLVGT